MSGADEKTTVATDVGELAVRIVGSGPPALLWHSLFVDSTSWDRVRSTLAESRTLILIDGPSHGRSQPRHQRFALSDCAEAAAQILTQLQLGDTVDWVGNAWGGHVGIVFAAAHPDRVKSLITIGTPVRALTRTERRNIVPVVALYRLLGPIKPLVTGVAKALLGGGYRTEDGEVVAKPLRTAERKGMYNAMQSVMLGRPDLIDELPRVLAPTLFVGVKDDPLAPMGALEDAAEMLPRGSTAVIAGGGHVAPLLQSPRELARVIANSWAAAEVPSCHEPSA
jgi:pimeloyl-ACP methyl ester carboxylesterase